MRDLITAGVRTGVQVSVAAIVAWLFNLGFEVDAVALEAILFSLVTGLVTVGLNWLQGKLPWLGKLLSLGLSTNTPSY